MAGSNFIRRGAQVRAVSWWWVGKKSSGRAQGQVWRVGGWVEYSGRWVKKAWGVGPWTGRRLWGRAATKYRLYGEFRDAFSAPPTPNTLRSDPALCIASMQKAGCGPRPGGTGSIAHPPPPFVGPLVPPLIHRLGPGTRQLSQVPGNQKRSSRRRPKEELEPAAKRGARAGNQKSGLQADLGSVERGAQGLEVGHSLHRSINACTARAAGAARAAGQHTQRGQRAAVTRCVARASTRAMAAAAATETDCEKRASCTRCRHTRRPRRKFRLPASWRSRCSRSCRPEPGSNLCSCAREGAGRSWSRPEPGGAVAESIFAPRPAPQANHPPCGAAPSSSSLPSPPAEPCCAGRARAAAPPRRWPRCAGSCAAAAAGAGEGAAASSRGSCLTWGCCCCCCCCCCCAVGDLAEMAATTAAAGLATPVARAGRSEEAWAGEESGRGWRAHARLC